MSDFRVLEAITSLRLGGADVFVADLCKSFARMGARVDVFCGSGRPIIDFAQERGFRTITWNTRGKIDPITVIKLARLVLVGDGSPETEPSATANA